jgi:tetratricopeptide (TPR) repeat protein
MIGGLMKTKITTVCLLLSLNFVTSANADSQSSTGDQSPVIKAGRDVTINYSSKEEIDKIVAIYAQQHKLDTEQIKSLAAAVTALSQGKDVIGTESQIQAAMAALAQGNSAQAKALFEKETQRVELAAKQGAEAYRNLGALAFLDNTQEALHAYRRATELDPDNADSWNQLGALLMRIGDLDEAIAVYNKVLALGKTHRDQEKIAWAYGNLGIIYARRGDLDKAIDFQKKSLKLDEGLGRKVGIARSYGNLGNIYQIRGELDKAIEFYLKTLKVFEELDDKEGVANVYGNLGTAYKNRGELDKAIEFQQKALVIDERMSNKQGMSEEYSNLGTIYGMRGELDKAIEFFLKALTIDKSINIKEGMAVDYQNLGAIYDLKGNKPEAKRYWQMSLELYKQLGSPNAKKVQGWLDAL